MYRIAELPPDQVIGELKRLGFTQVDDLQAGDVVVWVLPKNENYANHMAIYVGEHRPGDRLLLSANWPDKQAPDLYRWNDLDTMPAREGRPSLREFSQRYYRPPQ